MLAGTKHVLPKCARIMRLHGVLISIYIILVMFFSSFETIGVTCVLVVFCNFVFFKVFTFSCCVYHGRRSWGDFSWRLGARRSMRE